MKLGEGEEEVARYDFKASQDRAKTCVLTNRRLIVIYSNAEENYPLSGITNITIIRKSGVPLLVVGGLFFLLGLGFASPAPPCAIASFGIGGGLVYFGIKGKTELIVKQAGGSKRYVIRNKDPKLLEFVEALNRRLS